MTDIMVQKAKTKPVGMPATIRIIVEDNENIPPTGLPLGLNGRSYIIRTNEPVDVPPGLVEILRNARVETPIIDPNTRKVMGYKSRLRFPFQVVPEAA